MKTCSKCKTPNNDNARFCIECQNYLMPEPRKCQNGHTMDPTWSECAYCANQAGADSGRTPTRISPDSPVPTPVVSSRTPSPVPPPPPPPRSDQPKRRMTQFSSPVSDRSATPAASQQGPGKGPERRIVGVLVTYTWKPEGQIFPVREGRNLIGRDPEQCEIAVPEDITMSSMNSHITYRKTFVAGDMVSMSGTDINGEPIEQQFRSLPNYATLRAGSTYWTFIQIEPAADGTDSSKT